MEQLDLLWDLESQYSSLYTHQKQLVDLESNLNVKRANKKMLDTEKKLNSSKLKRENTKIKLVELEQMLKGYTYTIEELEKDLYDGHITDLRQLGYLSDEKDKLKKTINEVEVQILNLMDEVEKVDQEFLLIESSLKDIKDDNSKIKETTKEQTEEVEMKIENTESKIQLSEEKIDKTLLHRYTQIKKSRVTGIVGVKDFACPVCNIRIPTFAVDKLKNTKDIINCESCGRILYYKPV